MEKSFACIYPSWKIHFVYDKKSTQLMTMCVLQLCLVYSLYENRTVIEQEHAKLDQTERADDQIACGFLFKILKNQVNTIVR
jgi:hypothetical protein